MNEADARRVLLLRAFEREATPLWGEADAAWASGQAQREVGERATSEEFLAARARLGCARLAERDPVLASVLPTAGDSARVRDSGTAGWGWVLVLLGFVAGLMGDALGAGQRINILAPPLLGLLGWNLLVYAGLLVVGLRGRAAPPAAPGPLRRLLAGWVQRATTWAAAHDGSRSSPPLARFALDWSAASAPLQAARLAALLHTAAAALALGAIVSLYLRGLAFEYLAGWTSTFLSPAAVHAVLGAVLGPASHLGGIPLPDAAELARLRFSVGPGENAARWIHLYAITLGGAIVLPRAVMALSAFAGARRLAERLPLTWSDAYFVRLQRVQSGEQMAVRVLPYSYQLPETLQPALPRCIDQRFGPGVVVDLAANVPLGGEDDLQLAPPPEGGLLVVLMSLTATPERETHGAFLRQVASQVNTARWTLMIDESGFRQRLSGGDAADRIARRRAAWQALATESGQVPVFVDLRQPELVE